MQDLYKAFGEVKAVQGVSFNVLQGEIFSLLGPNGAGKTTTISMLATLLRPDQGDALVMGHSVRKDPMGVKSVLGVVPQEIALYEDLTARENLTFWGKMYGLRGASAEDACRRGAGDDRPDRSRRWEGGQVLRRNEAAGQHRRGAAAQAAGDLHGRADRGHRPAVAAQHPGQRGSA